MIAFLVIKQIGGHPTFQRVNAWTFPELAECREVFDRATGTQTMWEEADSI